MFKEPNAHFETVSAYMQSRLLAHAPGKGGYPLPEAPPDQCGRLREERMWTAGVYVCMCKVHVFRMYTFGETS